MSLVFYNEPLLCFEITLFGEEEGQRLASEYWHEIKAQTVATTKTSGLSDHSVLGYNAHKWANGSLTPTERTRPAWHFHTWKPDIVVMCLVTGRLPATGWRVNLRAFSWWYWSTMNRRESVEIHHDCMRFLLTHNPSSTQLESFVEVKIHWRSGRRPLLSHLLQRLSGTNVLKEFYCVGSKGAWHKDPGQSVRSDLRQGSAGTRRNTSSGEMLIRVTCFSFSIEFHIDSLTTAFLDCRVMTRKWVVQLFSLGHSTTWPFLTQWNEWNNFYVGKHFSRLKI